MGTRRARAAIAASTIGLVVAIACGGGHDGHRSGEGEDGTLDAGASGALPSRAAPSAIAYRDEDPRRGVAAGRIRAERASDESLVDEYRVYWLAADGTKLERLASLPKTASPLELTLAEATAIPPAATQLAIVGARGALESSPVAARADNFPTHVDVGGRAGADLFEPTEAFHDAEHDRLVVVGLDGSRPSLRACNHDGTGCTARVLDPHGGALAPSAVRAAVDPVARELLVVTNRAVPPWSEQRRGALLLCPLDGAGCTDVDLAAMVSRDPGRTIEAGRPIVDPVRRKLLVGVCSAPGSLAPAPSLLRCELDGSGCDAVDLAATGPGCPLEGFLDPSRDELVLVMGLRLVRCAPDGTRCAHLDLTGIEARSGGPVTTTLALDRARRKLLLVGSEQLGDNRFALRLVQCELDGARCAASFLAEADSAARAIVARDELFVASHNLLFRCALDGSACAPTRLDTGAYGPTPALTLDDARGAVLVAAPLTSSTGCVPRAPVLFRLPLDGSPLERHDISAGPGVVRYLGSSAIDAASSQLLVLSEAVPALAAPRIGECGDPVATRCNLDGSGCQATFAAPLALPLVHASLLGVLDGKVYLRGLVQRYPARKPTHAVLLRCRVDGSECAATSLLPEATELSPGGDPAVLSPAQRSALLVTHVRRQGVGQERVALFSRCELDGASCSAPAELPFAEAGVLAMAVAPDRDMLLFDVGERIVICDMHATSCRPYEDLPGSEPLEGSDFRSDLVVDARWVYALRRLRLARGGDELGLALFRCALDGGACSRKDLALAGGTHRLHGAALALDAKNEKLLVVTDDAARLRKPTLLRCELDGSGCLEVDLSAGAPPGSGESPTALVDEREGRLLVVAKDRLNQARPRLFSLDLWPRGAGPR